MKKVTVVFYLLVFLLIVPVIGGISAYKYYDFKVNDRVDYNEWTADLGSKLETDIAGSFFEKFSFINLNGAARNLLGQHVMNDVVKLNNGKLIRTTKKANDVMTVKFAERTAELNNFLAETGTPFLVMMVPYAVSPYDPQLPAGVEDYANADYDVFLNRLAELGVETMDLRRELHEDGIDQYEMMYRTDHHWNTHGGFYAYRKLEDYLIRKTGCAVDPRVGDISQYHLATYPAWHLGSYGQRTGIYFGGIDDFVLYEPQFPTMIEQAWTGTTGTLEAVFYDKTALEKKDYTNRYTYDNVLGGSDLSSRRFYNHMAENDLRILVISNSFIKAMQPFLLMGFADVQYGYFYDVPSLTTAAALRHTDPENPENISCNYDAVILLYEPMMIHADVSFEFLSDLPRE